MTDSGTGTSDTQILAERVRELEAENARLAAASPTRERPSGGRWRAVVSAICIVVAAILVPVSIVGAWARVQLVEEEAFVATLAPLVDDPAVQAMIIDESMEAISAQVDFDDVTARVFDGIAELGLPPRAADALELLQAPAASGLESLVGTTVTRVVESEAFADVWATTTRAAHRALTLAATSDGGGLVVRTDDGVGIQLGAIVERVKQNLVDRGLGVAQLIPDIDRVVIIGEGNNLAMVRAGYALTATLGWWLPFVTLGLFALGILIARRRSTAILGTGLALAIGGGALAVSRTVGSAAMGIVAGDLGLSPSALDVIYGRLVDGMTQTALVLALLGVFVAVLGWVMGGSGAARGLRRAVSGLNSSARRQLASRGLDTGGFGGWLARQKILVRTLVAVLAVLWLFALRPLSGGDIVLVFVVAFVVAWILELLQRRDDEQVAAETVESQREDAAADVAAASSPAPSPGAQA
ncbi:hypothetical protein HF576_07250 [Microbacterium sp. CFH 90308]|uniref:Integral membrane protein n=1 Tax=Microbacterium salsuginis TaxID=2722803 RepID=A0ABX1K9H4_9MICO|nr:hypothetical protein [Microbacterium sp. CFH 90308]NLP83637.1 hypothetical protein [Microbacterium sp. CFH 90308]